MTGTLRFDDLTLGEVGDFGPYVVTEEEIVAFGWRWDPQRMHVDPAAAAGTIFGGLIASGWHSGAIMMRMAVDGWLSRLEVIGGTAIDDVRLRRPVRPGDALRVRIAVRALEPAAAPRTGGSVRWGFALRNQADELVMEGTTTMLVAGRPRG
ncbi:MaoC/PaaZ C-terminal domain-containing protein [Patulibacter sp. S7RM1-6]